MRIAGTVPNMKHKCNKYNSFKQYDMLYIKSMVCSLGTPNEKSRCSNAYDEPEAAVCEFVFNILRHSLKYIICSGGRQVFCVNTFDGSGSYKAHITS